MSATNGSGFTQRLSGRKVAAARHEAGLTQKELAEQLGLSLWRLDRLETGRADAPASVESLARVTGKPAPWFAESKHEPGESGPTVGGKLPPSETNAGAGAEARIAVLVSLTLLVVIRFFTEVVPVLPRAANFVDVPILGVLAVGALLRPRSSSHERQDLWPFLILGLLFLTVCVTATLANPSRVLAGPVLVFIYGYVGPVALYLAVYRIWPVGSSLSLSRVLVVLGLLQLAVVGFIDLPRFISTGDPDEISGTFGENAYQLVFFLLLFGALLAGIFTFEPRRRIARAVPVLFVAILATIFLAQYRSLIFTTALAVLLIATLLGTVQLRGLVVGAVLIIGFAATLNYTAEALPVLRLAPAVKTLTKNPGNYVSERLDASSHVLDLYGDHPRYAVTGTGPGTYASRAWQTFGLSDSESSSNVAGAYASLLSGGVAYRTDVSDKYIRPRVRYGEVIQGSYALTIPYSDYSSLLAEVGIPGFAILVLIYLVALRGAGRMALRLRRGALHDDPLPALALATAVSFFVLLQMGVLQSWLEVTRVTFPTWMLLAVVTKEFRSRQDHGIVAPS